MPRLILDDAIFHVLNRGNAKMTVFHDDEDFEHFTYILAYYKDQYGFKLYHHCLIPNHFHFELKVDKGRILSLGMHDISQTYTNYYHKKYGTVGYLWQGRYKNMIVEEGDYHQKLGAYIERNPVRAGLAVSPEDWKWSSYRFYAFGEPLKIRIKRESVKKWVDLIDEDPSYEEFGQTADERQKNYRRFLLEMDDATVRDYFGLKEKKVIIGSHAFKERKREFFGRMGIEINLRSRGRPRKD